MDTNCSYMGNYTHLAFRKNKSYSLEIFFIFMVKYPSEIGNPEKIIENVKKKYHALKNAPNWLKISSNVP